MAPRIAVIDDEPDILHLLDIHLKKAGYVTSLFPDATSFLRSLALHQPDLILLDLMLPDMDGFEVCRRLKQESAYAGVPIIMLTAKGQEPDKVQGLELGADDYVTKPFSPRELVARVKAVLRRAGKAAAESISVRGMLTIDPERFEVTVHELPVALTAVEFKILHLLASHKGKVFSREKILDHLWGNEKAVIDRTVDVHIKNLRDKLGEAAVLVQNVRGVGYKVEA
jgi:two-component system phosphate regulon response regulator PhoB/two-component system alkaline phosphatase synthesis response regulator PhoP